ncbi:MAG: hypothetical protein AB1595_06330 [bacterium]
MTIKEEIENDIRKAGGSFNIKKGLPELQLTSATKEEYGDLTTNFSFILAGSLKIKPEKATELLKSKIEGKYIEKIEVIGGFLNMWGDFRGKGI